MARPREGSPQQTKSGFSARITVNVYTSVGVVVLQPSFPIDTTSKSVARGATRRLSEKYAAGIHLADETGLSGALVELQAAIADVAAAEASGATKAKIARLRAHRKRIRAEVCEALQARGLLEGAPAEVNRIETADEAFARVVPELGRDGFTTWEDRLSRLKRYASPEIGSLPITNVDSGCIRLVLHSKLVKESLAKTSVRHLRNDLLAVFGHLKETSLVPVNPVIGVKLPGRLREEKRPRVLLTDGEFDTFMTCNRVPKILQLKALCSRNFGGMRTSDLHAWDWVHVDLEGFEVAQVYRPKTDGQVGENQPTLELVTLVIPEQLAGMLRAYWEKQGKPTSGPVFPVLKGKRKGQRQTKRSHARELRYYLWAAGVHRPMPGFDAALAHLRAVEAELAKARADKAKGRVRGLQRSCKAAQKAAQALDVLQVGNDQYQCVEFHSFRRLFATAVGASGLNMQTAMALTGHKSPTTHLKYVKLSQKAPLQIPASAVAVVSASPLQKLSE